MKEFMTQLSDYISERKNDPEKNGSIFGFCMLGVVILVIIILCLLLLWRKNANEKNQDMVVETYEEKMETILAQGPGEDVLQQQYLENTEYLEEKINELINSMTEIRDTMENTIISQEDSDAGLQIQIDEILGNINALIIQLQNTKNQLSELTDIVNIMNTQTLPMIQEWIHEIEKQMEQVKADITNIYEKIAALETADKELKDKIKKIEGTLKISIEQNMDDIEGRLDDMYEQLRQILEQLEKNKRQIKDTQEQVDDAKEQIDDLQEQIDDFRKQIDDTQGQTGDAQAQINNLEIRIENLQNWINRMDGQLLLYQYDEDTNTLSFIPYREEE